MDEFEQAIIYSFDPLVSEDIKQKALAYIDQIKNSPDAWKFCLQRLGQTGNSIHLKFFCFQIFQDLILHKYSTLTAEESNKLKAGLINWLKTHLANGTEDPAIKNKYSQIVALLFKQEYPEQWPSFFDDYLSLLNLGPSVIDIFLRICKAIDEQVVSLAYRSSAELAQNTLIKDTMRDHAIEKIVKSWYDILVLFSSSNPSLINITLQNIKHYVGWIDINLIVNDKFIPLFCKFLSLKSVREEACHCFREIINKGMEPYNKLSLIQQLQIKNIISSTVLDDPDFIVKVGNLVNLTGMEILRALETSTNEKKFQGGELLLDEMLELLFKFFNNDSNDVSYSVYGLASLYIHELKKIKPLNQKQMQHITLLVQIVRNKMRLKDNDDDEINFSDYRKDLSNLFRNIFRICPEMVGAFVQSNIENIIKNQNNVNYFREMEISIFLLYQMGEGVSATSEETLKTFDKFFSSMISLLAQSNISNIKNQAVSIIYFETIVRYAKCIPLEQQILTSVLSAFLDTRGIHSTDPLVRSKAGYLLNKLVKQLKVQIFPYINNIIDSLKNHITISYEIQREVPFEEQLNFYESLGFLIGAANLPINEEKLYVEKILVGPITKLEEIINQQLYKTDTKENPFYTTQLIQLISVIGTFSKGFSSFNASTGAPKHDSYCNYKIYFTKPLQLIIQLPNLIPNNQEIILKTFFYMHRMVECLGKDLKPLLVDIIPILLNHTTNINTLLEFLVFINQLMSKYKDEFYPIINQTLQPIIFRIFESLNPPVAPEEYSDEERSLNDLKRQYYQFIQNILNNNLANVFTSQVNINLFEQILATIINGCQSTSSEPIQKVSFLIIKRLIEDLGPGGNHMVPGFQKVIYDQIIPICFQIPLSDTFNLSELVSVQILGEIGKILKIITSKYNDEFLNYMASVLLPTLSLSNDQIQQFVKLLLPATPIKEFQEHFTNFIRTKRGLPIHGKSKNNNNNNNNNSNNNSNNNTNGSNNSLPKTINNTTTTTTTVSSNGVVKNNSNGSNNFIGVNGH
ncbi:hypothetical protein CYY_009217 [Polysphondylium violaceum]|uniref:Exportin-T n=1 Tax=Polysphondylium violaceum TaxID=133409 RepID=A0A8J4PKI4_9MYCE|nr:hypothetical protein CYY_009217 [Polysphondylium violaceum]